MGSELRVGGGEGVGEEGIDVRGAMGIGGDFGYEGIVLGGCNTQGEGSGGASKTLQYPLNRPFLMGHYIP